MTEPSRLRPFVVFVLAITSIAVAGIFFSTTTSSGPLITNPDLLKKPGVTAKPQEYDQNGEHVLVIPYYNLTDGWTSTLLLTNQAPTETEIGITLYALDGQRLDVPAVTLRPHAADLFDLSQWASGGPFHKGSLKFRYIGQKRQVSGLVKVVHAARSLIFDEQAIEPKEYFKSSRLEAVWWLPSEKAQMEIVVANNGSKPLSADVTLHGSQKEGGSYRISLRAWETRVVDAKEILGHAYHPVPKIGGVSINHTGAPGAVLASVLIQEPLTGFSSISELRDPQVAVSSRLDGGGLRIGRVANEELEQVVVARNVADEKSVLSGRIVYTTADGTDGVIPIGEVELKPGEAANVDLFKPIKKARLRDVVAAGLEFQYTSAPGSIVMSALTMSESGNHVFRVPLVDVKSQASNTGKYALTIDDNSSSTVVYLKNATDETQKYTLQVAYPGGSYVQGLKALEAGRTLVIDLRELRDEQTPDQNGNKIPLNVREGYIDWWAAATKYTKSGQMQSPDDQVMIGRSESADFANAMSSTATYGCSCPPSFADSWIEHRLPNGQWQQGGFQVYMGQTVQVRAMERDHDCYWNWLEPYETGEPGSQNDPVATFAPGYNGVLTGATPGTAEIMAYWDVGYWYLFYDCCWFQSDYTAPAQFVTVIGVTISGPQAVQDGSLIDPTFTLTPHNGSPSTYQWSWTAPVGVGNNPNVTFTPANQATTVTNRRWFANPNVPCPSPPSVSIPPVATDSYYNSVYTIRGHANYSDGQSVQQNTTLTVNNYWNPAGTTAPPEISGGLTIGFNTSSNLWVVVNSGTLTRNTPAKVIYVPVNSQFYPKTVAHEDRHVWQYVSGMNSDLFTVSSLMAQLSPLTDPTQAGLNAKIAQTFNNWYAEQLNWVNIRRGTMEQDAHSVSDPILPQYAYQYCQ